MKNTCEDKMVVTAFYQKMMRDWLNKGSINISEALREVEKIEKMNQVKE